MKSSKFYFLLIFFILVLGAIGCTQKIEWPFYVIQGENVKTYQFEDLYSMQSTTITEIVIDKEKREVIWEGPRISNFGDSGIVNYISEDFYLVSIPYREKVIASYKKQGKLLSEEDGAPLKVISDPLYGCKCNWLKKLKIIEFIDVSKSLSIYGNVTNVVYFSGRDLNIFYSIQDILDNKYNSATLSQVLSKALPKEGATKIIIISENNLEKTYAITEVLNEVIFYENENFNIPSLGINGVRSIKVE
ncbi:MAG: hypothetical protein APG12_01275 [Candidatus Methanofastidiosum methylothiophilum]|uniref:Uncharacterized protein n=1 Tax=Candidatus Methanofastidiosum methylothiophilum TaxID=1705564 RepID=A0A150IQQ7_9EURY|nr:MAG: hypothetical protein APG10_00971 [Candidatus Methanofastidiosum methylthiophilus]KYC47290.1 MAG: hypothetical protein APG11_01264 [Candidatus Methanofastidiosum methylthiophilus]KYC49753.1 MAG: hypothetical protein APG12_01275 [Candidatus Methanofastidiosum methylthiophilus]